MGKNKKNTKDKVVKQYLELLYMTPQVITVKEIAGVLNQTIVEARAKQVRVEFWESMNVIELELPDGNSVDFELIEMDTTHPSDLAFIKNRQIQSIFSVTIEQSSLELVRGYFTKLTNELGGFICSDSDDFKPFYTENKE